MTATYSCQSNVEKSCSRIKRKGRIYPYATLSIVNAPQREKNRYLKIGTFMMTILSSMFLGNIFAVILSFEIKVSGIFPLLDHELKTLQAAGKKDPEIDKRTPFPQAKQTRQLF